MNIKIRKIFTLLLSLVLLTSTPAFANELEQKDTGLVRERSNSNFDMEKYVDVEAVGVPYNNFLDKGIPDEDLTISPNSIIIIPGLYKYEISASSAGQVYFPNQPFETLRNNTTGPMQVSDTFSEEAQVKLSGSIIRESEGKAEVKANFGFDYSYKNVFSRNIKTTINPGKVLKLYVEYQKVIVTEKEYILDTSNPGSYRYNKTRTKTVYKPTGLMYVES